LAWVKKKIFMSQHWSNQRTWTLRLTKLWSCQEVASILLY